MSDYKAEFFEKYAAAAIEEQKRYGIPASVTLAQMAVESGYGESNLARQDNNYFGIKASDKWIKAGKPWSYHHDDHYNDKFCTFASPLDSLEYHSKVLMADRYKACRQYASDDHTHWIEGIKKGGYATDPRYVATIEGVIKKYGLDKYDRQAISEAQAQGITIGYRRGQKTPAQSTTIASPVQNGHYVFPLERDANAGVITITSPFGSRTAPKAGASTNHMGLDMRASYEKVLATEDNGRVLSAKNEGKGGNVVRVEYSRADGERYQVAYMHLSQFNVREGDVVMAGQQVGVSGNTGNSTGPHLHFSVKKIDGDGNSTMIDPSVYLADIAVRGHINTRVEYQGNDLLASYKSAVREEQPVQGQDMYLSQLTQSDDPKDWLSFLMNGNESAISQSADPMAALIGSVFSGLFMLAAQLDMDSESLVKDDNVALSTREQSDVAQVITRERTGESHDYSRILQSSAAYYEAAMQQEQSTDNNVAIK